MPKTVPAKVPADSARRKAVTDAATRLTGMADHGADTAYLSATDIAQYRQQHEAAVRTLQEIAGHEEITAADRMKAEQTLATLDATAATLRERAAAAKIESDGFKKEITGAVADLSTRLLALQNKVGYLDADDLPSFNTTHGSTADSATKAATQPRVTPDDRDTALTRIADTKLAVAGLQAKADAAEVESDGFRDQIELWRTTLAAVLTDEQMAYLPADVAEGFRKQRAACGKELDDATEPQRVPATVFNDAETTFKTVRKQGQTLQKQAAKAKKALETRTATEEAAFDKAQAAAKDYKIDSSALTAARAGVRAAAGEKNWAEVAEGLDRMRDESARLLSYTEGLDKALKRIIDLPVKSDKVKIRADRYEPFRKAVTAKPRVDATAGKLLNELNDALQQEEDKFTQASAAQALRQQQRAEGLIPGRGGPPIPTATRADVGSTVEERQAVVEALDALDDPSADHSWAAKWGEYHGNGEGNLPGARGTGGYSEYYVRRGPGQQNIRRLVRNDTTGVVYYSPNHYGSVADGARPFVKVTDA